MITSPSFETGGDLVTVESESDATQLLIELASVAERQATVITDTSSVVSYVHSREWNLCAATADGQTRSNIVVGEMRRWMAPDGQMGYQQRGVGSSTEETEETEETEDDGGRSRWIASALPTPVQSLRAQLLSDGPPPDKKIPETFCLFHAIEQLHDQVISPALEGAFWRVLADEPGLKALGTTADRIDRRGVTVAYDFEIGLPTRLILIISPDTGRLLAVEEILTSDSGKLDVIVPAVMRYTAYLRQGYVSRFGLPLQLPGVL